MSVGLTSHSAAGRFAAVATPDDDGATDPLRILHVLRAPLGGLFRHVMDLARGQIALGQKVGLVVDSLTANPRSNAQLEQLAPSLALGLTRFPMRRGPHVSDPFVALRVARHIRAAKPDVVHGHGSKGGLFARAEAFLPNAVPAVRGYTPHGGSFNHRPGTKAHRSFMLAERLLTARTDILLFESDFIASLFDAYVGPCKVARRIVHNGIGPEEFIPVKPAPDAADYLYVGELRAAKGIDTLLQALAHLGRTADRRPRLNLVGSGPDRTHLPGMAAALGLSAQVRFFDPMPARTAFAMGRVLVVPSRAESLPYIVLEAIGAHIPLIATSVGGIPEIFGPYGDRLLPCDDPIALARAMVATSDLDPAGAARRTAELAASVEARFSIGVMVTGVVDGYRDALARRRQSVSPRQ